MFPLISIAGGSIQERVIVVEVIAVDAKLCGAAEGAIETKKYIC